MKDIILPKLFTLMRDTLLQADWYVTHSDPNDTFVVLVDPDNRIRCVLHYMYDCRSVYPEGTWTLKLNISEEDTLKCETCTRPIVHNADQFMKDYLMLRKVEEVLRNHIKQVD